MCVARGPEEQGRDAGARLGFKGFAPDSLAFFDRLAANNDREWLLAHKAEYDTTLKAPMMALMEDLAAELARRKVPLTADPAKSVMRINRDIRFARDKSLYKTHIAAGLTRDGSRQAPGMLYLHLSPSECFAGAGFHEMEPARLAAFRTWIATHHGPWRRLDAALRKAGTPIERDGAAKRLPQGFDAGLPDDIQDAVKLKSFITRLRLTASDLASQRLVDSLAGFAEINLGLLRFGWSALDG